MAARHCAALGHLPGKPAAEGIPTPTAGLPRPIDQFGVIPTWLGVTATELTARPVPRIRPTGIPRCGLQLQAAGVWWP